MIHVTHRVHASGARRRFQLLPDDERLGWTPYAWLVYLPTFVLEPVLGQRPPWVWVATALGTVAFLVSYFRAYWSRGRAMAAIVVFEALLGVAFAPVNTGSAVFFVYAAGFAGQFDRPRNALRAFAAI